MGATYSILTYDKSSMEYHEGAGIDETLALVKTDCVNWITVSGIALQDDHVALRSLLNHFQLNPMLFNSFFEFEQRPFEGEFDDCLYLEYAILLYRPAMRAHKRVTGSFILGSNFLIVLEQIPSGLFERTRMKILARHSRVQQYGADYLLYLLIKTIVINYQEMYKALVTKFELLEDEVIGHPGSKQVYDRILEVRDEFKPLYAYLVSLAEFVNTIREEETRFIRNGTKKRIGKTIGRETEALQAGYQYLRTWSAELIEIHRANVNESTNRVMKILTVISTIFLPLTFIVGIYGMNFAHMPELEWELGYPTVMLSMALLAGGALFFMRRKKWL